MVSHWTKPVLAAILFCLGLGVTTLRADDEPPPQQPANGKKRPPRVSVEILAHAFAPSDRTFDEIYGGGTVYALDVGVGIARQLGLWAGASRIAREGQLTYTREPTEMSVYQVGAGLRYRIGHRRVAPYAGLGFGWFFFEEKNTLGRVRDSRPGLVAHAGAFVDLHRHLALDLRGSYLRCSMQPRDFEIQLGGFEVGVGVVLRL
jgi:hypothetical protein